MWVQPREVRSGISEEEVVEEEEEDDDNDNDDDDDDDDEDEEVVDVETVLLPLPTAAMAGDIAETLLTGEVAVVFVSPDPELHTPSTASAGPYCNPLHPGSAARTPLTCSCIGDVSLHA